MPKLKKIALVKCRESYVVPDKSGILRRFFKLIRGYKPQYLILTTFHLDMQFLQDEVLSQISPHCKTQIYYSPFSRNTNTTNARGRSKVRFIKARTRVFHPKFILAIVGPHILIGIGSGNLTTGGWGGHNQEMFHFYADRSLIAWKGGGFNRIQQLTKGIQGNCIEYLQKLKAHEIHPDRREDHETTKRIIEKVRGAVSNDAGRSNGNEMIHNYDSSFYEVIKERFKKQIKEIHIFSPVHFKAFPSDDEGLSDETNPRIDYPLFDHFTRLFPRNGKPTIKFYSSDDVPKVLIKRLQSKGVEFYENKCSQSHLKAIVIKTTRKVYLVSGSANFSIPAIYKRCGRSGNSELMHIMDVTGQWPELRDRIIGKGKLREREGINGNEKRPAEDRGSPVIDQLEVIKANDNDYYCEMYSSLQKGKKITVFVQYQGGQENERIKPMKVIVSGPKSVLQIRSNTIWYKQLIKDQPLFCWYEIRGRRYFFPVNYNYDIYTEEIKTEDQRDYEEFLDHFGLSMRKRRDRKNNKNDVIVESREDDTNEREDKEAENQYQSSADKFYHTWKHIYRKLLEYKRKNDAYRLVAGKEEIERYLGSGDAKEWLTEVQINFVRDYMLRSV